MSGDASTTVDVMKENTARIMDKLDSQMPLYVKMHSDLYTEHNRLSENFFKAAYALEQAELNLLFHGQVPEIVEPWIRLQANVTMSQIEMASMFLKWYPQMYVVTLKFLDQALQNYVRAVCAPLQDGEASSLDDMPDVRKDAA